MTEAYHRPRTAAPRHQLQHHELTPKTRISFWHDGVQWGERGEFSGEAKEAFDKAEERLRFMVKRGRCWPRGKWLLQSECGLKREVTVK